MGKEPRDESDDQTQAAAETDAASDATESGTEENSAAAEDAESASEKSDAEETPADEIAKLKSRLQRTVAEFQNFRKQSDRRLQDRRKFITRDIFEQILPIVDNFGAAMTACDAGQDAENVLIGVRMIHEMLHKLLADHQIAAIPSSGTAFDPDLHEAVSREETEETDAGLILREVQRGYLMDGLVIRHARVVVSAEPAVAEAPAESTEEPAPTDEADEPVETNEKSEDES